MRGHTQQALLIYPTIGVAHALQTQVESAVQQPVHGAGKRKPHACIRSRRRGAAAYRVRQHPADLTTVDHKYNPYSFVKKPSHSVSFGIAALAGKPTPSWAPPNTITVYDHRYNTYSFVPK